MRRCLLTLRSPNRSARHAAQLRNRGPLSGCARFQLGNTVPGAPARVSAPHRPAPSVIRVRRDALRLVVTDERRSYHHHPPSGVSASLAAEIPNGTITWFRYGYLRMARLSRLKSSVRSAVRSCGTGAISHRAPGWSTFTNGAVCWALLRLFAMEHSVRSLLRVRLL
jgi:hypothetical protein